MEHPLDGGIKVYINGPGYMTKMASMPKNGKTLKNLLLWSRWTDWYVASGTLAHRTLYKSWSWVDLDLFYGRANFGYICFSMEKVKKFDFWKVGRYRKHVGLL